MIHPPRFRLAALALSLGLSASVLAAVASVGCDGPRICRAIGCLDGLNVNLDDSFDPNRSYTIQVIDVTSSGAPADLGTCALAPAPQNPRLTCAPGQSFGGSIYLGGARPATVRISVASEGIVLSDETVTPTYTSREINGEGCGTCTQASVAVGGTGS